MPAVGAAHSDGAGMGATRCLEQLIVAGIFVEIRVRECDVDISPLGATVYLMRGNQQVHNSIGHRTTTMPSTRS